MTKSANSIGLLSRRGLFSLILVPVCAPASEARFLRGRLIQTEGSEPRLRLADGRLIRMLGDEPTQGVLSDPRLKNADFEIGGTRKSDTEFEIDPIHTRSLFAYQDGKRLMVTYWCDICYIRTFTPGQCWCCQDWTRLDLKDPDTPDPKP